jgi:hypothetical protein
MRVKYKQGVAAPKQQESRAKMLANPEKSRKTRDVTHAGFFSTASRSLKFLL